MKKILPILVASLFLAACGGQNHNQSASPAPQASATAETNSQNPNFPTYRVASQLTYPPFHFQGEHGEPTGFEMELLQAVAKAGEFNVQITNAPRSTLEKTLDEGLFQIWSSTVSISPERQAKMDFSQPFMHRDRDVIYILDNETNKNIQSVDQLKGKKIAVNEFNKSAPEVVAKLTGSADNAVVTKSYHVSMRSLYTDKVDGVLDNDLVLANYVKNQPADAPKTRSLLVSEKQKDFAFAVKKGEKEILDKLNKGLEKVKADGTYQKLVEKWFGNEQI